MASQITTEPNNIFTDKIANSLYFAMEPVTNDNLLHWNDFCGGENRKINQLFKEGQELLAMRIKGGIEGFGNSLSLYFSYQKRSPHEIWVLYASRTPVTEAKPKTENIEMVCTVSTSSDLPFTTHMGIFRPVHSAVNPQHKGISVDLHSFGARVMRRLHPEKIYMITSPMVVMEKIFIKALGQEHISIAEDLDFPKRPHGNQLVMSGGRDSYTFHLKAPEGNTLLDVNSETVEEKHMWYFRRETTFSGNSTVVIDLEALANYRTATKS